MNSPENTFLHINSFFDSYAHALEIYDTKGLAWHYLVPCTFLADDNHTVFTEASKLEGFFNQGATFYKQFGIAHSVPTVWTKRQWTDKIAKVKVNWQYFDALKMPLYTCDYQYVLKLDKNNDWKIILSVSINEKERMEEWLASRR